MHKKLEHLSDKEIAALGIEYQTRSISLKSIVEKYQIDIYPNNLATILPNVLHRDEYCEFCTEINLVSKPPRRSDSTLRQKETQKRKFCPNCLHTAHEYCRCKNCSLQRQVKRRQEADLKIELIKEKINYNSLSLPKISELTLKDGLPL